MPGIGGFRQKRRGIPLAEKPGRIIENGQFAPAVGPELIAGKVAFQRGLKFLFDEGIFIGGFRLELVKKRLDGRQQVFPILLADLIQGRSDLFSALSTGARCSAALLLLLGKHGLLRPVVVGIPCTSQAAGLAILCSPRRRRSSSWTCQPIRSRS